MAKLETQTSHIVAAVATMPIWKGDAPPDPTLGFYRTYESLTSLLGPSVTRKSFWKTTNEMECTEHFEDPGGDADSVYRVADPAINGLVFCRKKACPLLGMVGGCPIELRARQERLVQYPEERIGAPTQLILL